MDSNEIKEELSKLQNSIKLLCDEFEKHTSHKPDIEITQRLIQISRGWGGLPRYVFKGYDVKASIKITPDATH